MSLEENLATAFERVGDEFKNLSISVGKLKPIISDKTIKCIKDRWTMSNVEVYNIDDLTTFTPTDPSVNISVVQIRNGKVTLSLIAHKVGKFKILVSNGAGQIGGELTLICRRRRWWWDML